MLDKDPGGTDEREYCYDFGCAGDTLLVQKVVCTPEGRWRGWLALPVKKR